MILASLGICTLCVHAQYFSKASFFIWEMVQSVKHLPDKCEDLSSDIQDPYYLGFVASTYNRIYGETGSEDKQMTGVC